MGRDRYPSVNPFTTDQKDIFFGREKERDQLLKLIDLETLVVLHSKSGLGKSSLLNASIKPAIEELGNLKPIFIRLYAHQKEDEEMPIDKLNAELERQAGDKGTFLDSLVDESSTVWYYKKRIQASEPDKSGLLLIFDQFEELFSYPKEAVTKFAEQLASAVYNSIPQDVSNKFEERFLENEKFLDDDQMELLHKPFKLKVLMAIRSDRMSFLSDLSVFFPKILTRLFHLKALSVESAEDAILRPAFIKDPDFDSKPFDYSDEALEFLLEYLTKKGTVNIESYQLQILCHHIEKNVLPTKDNRKIEQADIGNPDIIYENYYANQIAKLGDEKTQLAARRLIEEGLINEKEERRLGLYGSQVTQFYGISEELLDKLVNSRLIRPESHRKGGYIYELSHDSIVKPILKAKRKRKEKEEKQKQKALKEQQEAEARRLREEYRKEKQRVKNYRLLLLFAFLFVAIAGVSIFLYVINIRKQQEALMEKQELQLKNEIQRKLAESSKLTSYAMMESKIDRTLALNLAIRASDLNEKNAVALKVRNDLLIDSEAFPFYQKIIQGHPGYITDLAVSPDGKQIVSACQDEKIRIWDVDEKEKPIEVIDLNIGIINDVDWLDDGRILCSGDDKMVKVLKKNGEFLFGFQHSFGINDTEYSSEAGLFAVADYGGGVRLFDAQGNKLKYWERIHQAEVSNVTFINNSQEIVTSGFDRSILKIDLKKDTIIELVSGLPAGIQNMDYHSEEQLLAAGLVNGQIKVWKFVNDSTINEILTIFAHTSRVSDIDFAEDGKKFISCSWDKSAKLWNLDGTLLRTFLGHKDGLRAVVVSENKGIVFTGGEDKVLKIWPIKSFSDKVLNGFSEDVTCVDFSKKYEEFLIGSLDFSARLHRIDGSLICEVDHKDVIFDVAISNDGELLATAGKGGNVHIWNRKGRNVKSVNVGENNLLSVSFSPDDKKILTGGAKMVATIWDLESQKAITTFRGHQESVTEAVFSPDGQYVLTASKDKTAILWTIAGDSIKILRGHTDRVNSVAFSPDNKHMLTSSWDNTFKLWQIDSTHSVDFLGHYSDVNKVCFSNDGTEILSASSDNTVRLWNLSGQELPSIISHPLSITDAAFSADGEYIVTTSRDNTARIWKRSAIKEMEKNLPAPTEEQKQQYGWEEK